MFAVKPPRLSICIPTYNRAGFIGETLESIASQAGPEVEVIVSDNASTDNTAEIVESFRSRLPRLVYSRATTNEGYAVNFFRAASLATGDYAWLLGSDDIVIPGRIQEVLGHVETGDTLYIYDRIETNSTLVPIQLDRILDPGIDDRTFRPAARESLLRYFRHSRSIASLFSFMSTLVFKRSAWEAVELKDKWLKCFFPHAIRMWGMFAPRGTLRYIDVPLVLARLDNDTFNPDGKDTVRRVLLNFDGYRMIRDEYWANDPELRGAMEAVMRRSHPHRGLLKMRRIVRDEEVEEVCSRLDDFGYSPAFTWFYRTDLSRRLVQSMKMLFVRLGLSPDLAES